jgi:hydroxymethylpyrimidine pyrophosphatase-like HAD family hydrolase
LENPKLAVCYWLTKLRGMGKPFLIELKQLPLTYRWLQDFDISAMAAAVRSTAQFPMVATGSGGSLSAAALAASLHQHFTGNLAKVATPLELLSTLPRGAEIGVNILSAGGRNPDILAALTSTIALEPRRISVHCSSVNSPLGNLARRFPFVDLIEFSNPVGKDGFLATNSLLLFSGLLIRAYCEAFGADNPLPATFEELLFDGRTHEQFLKKIRAEFDSVLERDTFVVLFAENTRTGAIDLESKFTEAGLGAVQLADYRNFAHGRHHWLAKHGQTTGVIAFETKNYQSLAKKTISLLPAGIPVAVVPEMGNPFCAQIGALAYTFYITYLAGLKKGIDPGRPGVPPFGRKIYHLKSGGSVPRWNAMEVAIFRKARADIGAMSKDEVRFWRKSYQSFVHRLQSARFGAVAMDYDGTICDLNGRFAGIPSAISKQMGLLLKARIHIGIATGRGDSVRSELRTAIPRDLWKLITVGYYNGAKVISLENEEDPSTGGQTTDSLSKFQIVVEANRVLMRLANWRFRSTQASAFPHPATKFPIFWDAVFEIVHRDFPDLVVMRSGHSLDILPKESTKEAVVKSLKSKIDGLEVLCIGDCGRWPGNDHALLAEGNSLSVDEGSLNPETCWNIAPQGFRGVAATLYYLSSLKVSRGAMILELP